MCRTVAACVIVLNVAALGAQNKEQGRLETCGVVMEEILGVEDNIPQALLDKAECVIVVPSMMTVAAGGGGNFGRGAMVCRSAKLFDGRGAPPPCIRSRAAASDSRLASSPRTWCSW
jgi:lipid-binding SYLF domain-containing protein